MLTAKITLFRILAGQQHPHFVFEPQKTCLFLEICELDEGVQIDCEVYSTRLFKHNSLMPMDYGLYDCCYERKNRTPMNDDADYDRKQLSPLIIGCTATTSIDLQQRRGNRSKHKRIPNAKCGIALSPHSCHSQFRVQFGMDAP